MKVIFRYWQDSVIALFPEVAVDNNPHHCLSYQHIGQHGSADPFIICTSRPATSDEYVDLKLELESLFDYQLEIVKYHTTKHYEKRKEQINDYCN